MRSNFQLSIFNFQFKKTSGYTLVEVMIAVFIFAIIMFVTVQTLASTFKSTTKSENEVSVRENIDYALNVMERNLRNSASLDCANSDSQTLSYTDQYNNQVSFYCDSSVNRIASASAYITTSDIHVDCTGVVFVCDSGGLSVPPSVSISLSAWNADAAGADQSVVNAQTTVQLRSYNFH